MKKLRSKLLQLMTHHVALPMVLPFRKQNPFRFSMSELLELESGTLGRDLAEKLTKNGFHLLPNYERHDCKHLILEFEMDEKGEACMQFYFLGNRHCSFPVLITVTFCLFLMPDYWSSFYKNFKKGKKGKSFHGIDFNSMILKNTIDLKKEFNPDYIN